jgi:acetyltransferase-like isoleucine patch superfamily enzyme
LITSGHIGRFCSISPGCTIGLQEHPLALLSTSPQLYGDDNLFGVPRYWEEFAAPPSIGSDVWIGAQVVVLQGVHIGHGAVIAAGAVITRDIPPYAIVGGVPAKVIRMRFDDEIVQHLIKLQWWDWPVQTLRQHASLFCADTQEVLSRLKMVVNSEI